MTQWNVDVPQAMYLGPLPGRGLETINYDLYQWMYNALTAADIISIDTETTGLNVIKDFPLYWSISWENQKYRATVHICVLNWFKAIFDDPSKTWVLANAKFDMHMLANVGIILAGKIADVAVMHALLYEDKPHGLKFICKHLLGWVWGDFQDTFGKISEKQSAEALIKRAEQENFNLLVEYASNDAVGTLGSYWELRKQLEHAPTSSLFNDCPPYIETLWDLFHKVEMPYTPCLWRMERHGVKVNQEVLDRAKPQAEAEINRIGREIARLRGKPININSPIQLQEWLIKDMQLPPIQWTKGGKKGIRNPKLDADFLEHYADKGVAACRLILDHRKYTKLLGTYIIGLSEVVDSRSRIHTRYNQDVARTGRLSSSEPNMQTIPKPENDFWALREAFIPEDGYDIICLDQAQLEMRLLAAASGEKAMIAMIESGKDIHIGNAEIVFGLPYDDIKAAKACKDKSQLTQYMKECLSARDAVKSIGFGQAA